MNIKRIGITILIFFMLRFVISCCNCPETKKFFYKYDAIDIISMDNSGDKPIIVRGGKIPKQAYGFRLYFSMSQFTTLKLLDLISFKPLYAQDCWCPPEMEFMAHDTITELKIITLNDFDSTHFANSDISSYFKILTYKYINISDYIKSPEMIYDKVHDKDSADFFLMVSPVNKGEYRFKVDVLMSGGTTLTATINPIILE